MDPEVAAHGVAELSQCERSTGYRSSWATVSGRGFVISTADCAAPRAVVGAQVGITVPISAETQLSRG
jgi:hypothetical protein